METHGKKALFVMPNIAKYHGVARRGHLEVISLDASDSKLIQEIIQIRQNSKVKFPDAIIAATALQQQATLVSNDGVFKRISGLSWQTF